MVHLAGQLMEHLEAAGSCSAVLDVTAPGPSAGFPSHITRVWEGVFLRFCSLKNSFFLSIPFQCCGILCVPVACTVDTTGTVTKFKRELEL